MKFIRKSLDQASLKKSQFYWEAGRGVERGQYYLYNEINLVASLCLPEEQPATPRFHLGKDIFELRDSSSFFVACMYLIKMKEGQCVGCIEKSARNPGEGTISLLGKTYGWKFRNMHESSLLLMDQHRNRLFSYHYTPDFVRLLLNKAGRGDAQLIPLLCIGLYLLPVWHSTHMPEHFSGTGSSTPQHST